MSPEWAVSAGAALRSLHAVSRPSNVPERPSADAFFRAFKGQPYGVVGPQPVARNRRRGPGWGSSREEVSEITLNYLVGRQKDEVSVNTSVFSRATLQTVQILVVNLLLRSIWQSRPLRKFPIDIRIERQRLTLSVNGVDCKFIAYSAGPVMRAVTELEDVVVTVEGPVHLVPKLRLASLRPKALARWLSPRGAR